MTFAQLKALIADDLQRSDLTTQISQAVLDAVEDQERTRFYFNERRDAPAFSTVASQELYTSTDDADIATIAHIDNLILIRNGDRRRLLPQSEQWMDAMGMSAGITGCPTDYSYLGKRIRLYPIPDAVYQVYMTGQVRFTALSADGDTNAWTTDAQQLIRAAAKEKVYRDVIQDPERAAIQATEVEKQRGMLLAESMKRGGPLRVKATRF